MLTEEDIKYLEKTFVTKDELQLMKSDLIDKLDSIFKEVLAI